MAEGPSSFRTEAIDQLNNAEDLDKSLRVVRPRVWVVLAAIIALLLGITSWAFFGAVSTSVTTTAVLVDNEIVCLVPAEASIKVGADDSAQVNGNPASIAEVSSIPYSRDEVKDLVKNDYLVAAMMGGRDWAYLAKLKLKNNASLANGVPLETVITTERVSPIELVTKKDDTVVNGENSNG